MEEGDEEEGVGTDVVQSIDGEFDKVKREYDDKLLNLKQKYSRIVIVVE